MRAFLLLMIILARSILILGAATQEPPPEDSSPGSPRRMCRFSISVSTADKWGAGTDARVYLQAYDHEGTEVFPESELVRNSYDLFERGNTDMFDKKGRCVNDICRVVLSHDRSGSWSDWLVERVRFRAANVERTFEFYTWLTGSRPSVDIDECF